MDQVGYSDILGLVFLKLRSSWETQMQAFSKALFTPPTFADVFQASMLLLTVIAALYGVFMIRADYKIRVGALEKLRAKME